MKVNIDFELNTDNKVDAALLKVLLCILNDPEGDWAHDAGLRQELQAIKDAPVAKPVTQPVAAPVSAEPESKPAESQAVTRTRRTKAAAPVPPAEPTQPAPKEPEPQAPELPAEAPMIAEETGTKLDYRTQVMPVLSKLVNRMGKEWFVGWLAENFDVDRAAKIPADKLQKAVALANEILDKDA